MKVSINKETKKEGIFSKKEVYYLTYRVELTPEERAVAESKELRDQIVFSTPSPNDERRLLEHSVKSVCSPKGHSGMQFKSLAAITQAESDLKEGLKALSSNFKAAANFKGGEEVLEF